MHSERKSPSQPRCHGRYAALRFWPPLFPPPPPLFTHVCGPSLTQAYPPQAVLTTYLTDIQHSIGPSGQSLRKTTPIMCNSAFEKTHQGSYMRHNSQPEVIPPITTMPTLSPYFAAGFVFSAGQFVRDVPYDPYLAMVFMGEEISVGVRGFTHGYVQERSEWRQASEHNEFTRREPRIPEPSRHLLSRALFDSPCFPPINPRSRSLCSQVRLLYASAQRLFSLLCDWGECCR